MTAPTVLIVENHNKEQFVLRQLLKKFDFDTQIVSSVEAALAEMEKKNFAAVLLDVRLQGVDGLECTRLIRQKEMCSTRRTPIIGMSASPASDEQNLCLQVGMDDYISKPCDIEALRRILLRHVYDAAQPNLKTLRPLPPEDLEADVSLGELSQ